MPDASFLQTSFLGGEWSPYAQGRADNDRYRTGMNVCRNAIPVKEGGATRRPGTRMAGTTRSGNVGVLRNFDFEQSHPYSLELTNAHMRFFSGANLVVSADDERDVVSISGATPAEITVAPNHTLVTGDQVRFKLEHPELGAEGVNPLLGRDLEVTVTGVDSFTVKDALTAEEIDGSTLDLGTHILLMEKIVDVVTPYTQAILQEINTVQDQEHLLLLHPTVKPYLLESTTAETADSYAVFSFGAADILDGPYYDPVSDGAVVSPSGTSGSITLTISGGTTRWATTDVGRHVRLFSEPADWSNVTAYAAGDQVKYKDAYYSALRATTGDPPDTSVEDWAVDTTAAVWTWAQITAVTSATVATATIRGDALPRTLICRTWRLGLYSDTTGWPTCGVYHENRLWLSGTVGNRIDGSKTGDLLNFAPTAADGTVADDNACQYVFAATDVNKVFWMVSDEKGIVCGTQAGEWVVRSSQQDDPLTPTSVQARRVTQEGCANVQAVRCGLAIAFVQRWQKSVFEFLTTDVRGYSARSLSGMGKHLTAKTGVAELAYQKELAPILWARTNGGELIGCTYQRSSPFANEEPDFAGWHRHDLGNSYSIVSIQTGPSFGGNLDALSMVAKDPTNSAHYVFVMTDIFEEENGIADAYFVDQGVGPAAWRLVGSDLTLYGLWLLEGKTVDVFVGGVDLGQMTVADGKLTITIGAAGSLLTMDWLNDLTTADNFRGFGLNVITTPAGLANPPSVDAINNVTPARGQTGAFSYTRQQVAFDWENRRFVTQEINGGLRTISLDDYSQIAQAAHANTPGGGPIMVDRDGYVYAWSIGFNQGTIWKYHKDTLAFMSTWGAGSISDFETTPTGPSLTFQCSALQVRGRNFMISTSATINEIAVFDLEFNPYDNNAPGMGWTGFAASTDEPNNRIAVAKNRGSLGHVIVTDFLSQSQAPIGVYRLLVTRNGDVSMQKRGTVAFADLGLPWKHYSDFYYTFADNTVGEEGVIILFRYDDAPTWSSSTVYDTNKVVLYSGNEYRSLVDSNQNNQPDTSPGQWENLGAPYIPPSDLTNHTEDRLVKIKLSDLSVAWNVNVEQGPVYDNIESRVNHGHLAFVSGRPQAFLNDFIVYDINTVTGATTQRHLWLGSPDTQAYNDYTGELIFLCGFPSSSPPGGSGITKPVPVGTSTDWNTSPGDYGVFGNTPGPFLPPAVPPANAVVTVVPAAIGYTYTTQGQILRAIAAQEAGAANGPALGKTRRSHMAAFLMHGAQGVEVGTVFGNTRPAIFRSPGGTTLPLTTLFSGTYQTTVEDDYSFDSMLCWEVTRPYPATMLAIGPNLHTQDR